MTIAEIIFHAIQNIDQVNRDLADDIAAIVEAYGNDPIDVADISSLLESVDEVLEDAYGSTRPRAVRSTAFAAIVEAKDFAVVATWRAFLEDLDREMRQVNPEVWAKVRTYFMEENHGLGRLYAAFGSDPTSRELQVIRAGLLDPNRRWVSPTGYRLSDRVWESGQSIRNSIDQVLRDAARRGEGPITTARRLQVFLNPNHAPVRYRRDGAVIQRAGKVRGGGSKTSRTRVLSRTEARVQAQMATVEAVKAVGWAEAGLKWDLSPQHPEWDICDILARQSSDGMPPGVYRPDEVPRVPHPQCLCGVTPWFPDRAQLLDHLERQVDREAGVRSREGVFELLEILAVG